jgi:hypothetical protein
MGLGNKYSYRHVVLFVQGSRLLPILFSAVSPKVCMSGYRQFLLCYPIIYIRYLSLYAHGYFFR